MSETGPGNGATRTEERPAARGGDRVEPEAFARSEAAPPPPRPRRPLYKRPLVLLIGGILIIGGIIVGVLWWLNARHYESTDDAFVNADVTQVSPRVAGYVQAVNVQENQNVPQGFELVTLDAKEYQTKVEQARAAVNVAQAGVRQSQDNLTAAQAQVGAAQAAQQAAHTELQRAQNEMARYEKLPPGATTQQQLINLRAAVNSAQAQVDAAKQKTAAAKAQVQLARSQILANEAGVKEAQAKLQQAQLHLDHTHIHAPIAGTVTNRTVQVGDYVQVGQDLMALVPHKVYVTANFKETQLADMHPGQEAVITIDAYPGHVFHGRVESIQRGSGAAFSLLPPENATGNYVKVVQRVPVRLSFDPEGFRMGPGMSAVPKVKVR